MFNVHGLNFNPVAQCDHFTNRGIALCRDGRSNTDHNSASSGIAPKNNGSINNAIAIKITKRFLCNTHCIPNNRIIRTLIVPFYFFFVFPIFKFILTYFQIIQDLACNGLFIAYSFALIFCKIVLTAKFMMISRFRASSRRLSHSLNSCNALRQNRSEF